MTTLVQTRQPLQVLSMSNQPKRRRSSRLAAYDEQDGDFHFTRGSKRVKTEQPAPIPEDEPAPTPPAPAPAPAPRKGRPPKQNKDREAPPPQQQPPAPKRSSKRRSSQITTQQEEAPPPPPPPQRSTRQRTRTSLENIEKEETTAKATTKKATNGVSRKQQRIVEEPPEDAAQSTPTDMHRGGRGGDNASESKKIALPFSDTPIINRNKEMRRKTGGRRSSLGMRGRRASSLIENGHSAIPHKEVDPSQFYKHIEADGLTEPRRMKQLLTWCGERALAEKPPLGSLNSNAILGARAIQDQLLKDFAAKSEFSDWFAREDIPRPPAIVKPNPRNIEHEEKIRELEERIKRLKAEKKTWQTLKQPPPELPPLFRPASTSSSSLETDIRPLPDASLLDPDEAQVLASLLPTDPSSSSSSSSQSHASMRPRIHARLQALQASLEFKIDRLADSVHKVEQRVTTASRQADRVLGLSAARLKEREDKERAATGTKDMPVMEVLRSLGRILPEGGGG
ncbi:Mis12-Mtw1 protein family-domain-containing protein [Whalleya microplaca]|nr:Mis12-Mtw1 protein family-domain-containing protein [Whalleya microplaca]